MRTSSFFTLLLIFTATAAESFGACHAVGPSATGNGSGSDWNNRMNKLPSNLVRGDTYYLMDGSYGSYNFTTANSGTNRITVKKAQSDDFGSASDGCSNDISAGWNAATMGSEQAIFTAFDSTLANRSYLTLDGNGVSTAAGCGTSSVARSTAKDCGIKLTSTSSNDGPLDIGAYSGGSNRTNGWIIRYVEWQGAGDANTVEQNGIWCRDGCDDLLIEHVWWHEAGTDFIKVPFTKSATIRNSHFKQNHSNPSFHGQFWMSEANVSNVNFYNNVIQDIEGTAIWTFNTGCQANNINLYNNVLLRTDGSSRAGTSNGILACINSGSKCTNVAFVGNSIVNYKSDWSGALGILSENNSGSSYTWANNLFYLSTNSTSTAVGFNLNGATLTNTNNSYLNSGNPSGGTANNNITVASGAPNPFVNWQNGDFRLANQNTYWGAGLVMASPFNVDAGGSTRPGADGTWNRGAFEYAGTQAPAAPTNLTSSVR